MVYKWGTRGHRLSQPVSRRDGGCGGIPPEDAHPGTELYPGSTSPPAKRSEEVRAEMQRRGGWPVDKHDPREKHNTPRELARGRYIESETNDVLGGHGQWLASSPTNYLAVAVTPLRSRFQPKHTVELVNIRIRGGKEKQSGGV